MGAYQGGKMNTLIAHMRAESERWSAFIKRAGIKLER